MRVGLQLALIAQCPAKQSRPLLGDGLELLSYLLAPFIFAVCACQSPDATVDPERNIIQLVRHKKCWCCVSVQLQAVEKAK